MLPWFSNFEQVASISMLAFQLSNSEGTCKTSINAKIRAFYLKQIMPCQFGRIMIDKPLVFLELKSSPQLFHLRQLQFFRSHFIEFVRILKNWIWIKNLQKLLSMLKGAADTQRLKKHFTILIIKVPISSLLNKITGNNLSLDRSVDYFFLTHDTKRFLLILI